MDADTISKNGASLKSQRSRGGFLMVYFTSLALLLSIVCSTAVMAQNEISFEDFMGQAGSLFQQAQEYVGKGNFQMAEKSISETLSFFARLSQEIQEEHKNLNSELYYALALCLSMQSKTVDAVDAFENAVKHGFSNYSRAITDLFNIRTNERYIALMESIRKDEDADFIDILRQSGKYQKNDTSKIPRFSYEAATSNNLKNVRQFFKLDSIAGQGDEISKIINLMAWVNENIRYDGSNYALCEFTSIDFYNYHKSTGKGINCRHLAMVLNEMYLAMGFKSRYVTCLPKDENDSECHVINSVYSTTLNKWLWMDSSFNAYVKDENDNLLSIEEVRERLIDGRPLSLNEGANWKNMENFQFNKEFYLDFYMAKNLYWFQCPVHSCFNSESRYRNTNQTYISLYPLGYERSESEVKEVIIHDAAYFWEHCSESPAFAKPLGRNP